MRSRSATGALSANPALVGAVTVMVTIVAVFLAYNANNGLPFVPTYKLDVLVPDANSLVRGNEVRIGGARVGLVKAVVPETLDDGSVVARAEVALDPEVEPLPVDSEILIRPRSTIALKYLEIEPGKSGEGFAEGDTVPLTAATPEPVELDQFFNIFNEKTREGSQQNIAGYGNALTGRGTALNEAFGVLPGLLRRGEPAARNLASRKTNFAGFWRNLAGLAAEVAPVAAEQAQLFVGLDGTFRAFAEVADPYIKDTISGSPPTLDEATRSFPVMRPFLRHSAEFFDALAPGAASLARTSPAIESALAAGVPVLRRSPEVNEQLEPSAQALVDFQNAPGVLNGLDQLTDTNQILRPTLGFIAPVQSTCNYLTLLFRNVASLTGIGDGLGHWVRAAAFSPPLGPNSEGSPAAAPANGGEVDRPIDPSLDRNFLHTNPYPNTAAPGQTLECEAGNERFLREQRVVSNVPGNQGVRTEQQTDAQLREGGIK